MKAITLASALLAGTSASTIAHPALAQEAPSRNADGQAADTVAVQSGGGSEAASGRASERDIVVTGSRVIKNGNNSPTPITVLPSEDILRIQPTTIADGLNLLPVYSSPRNQYGNPNAGVGGGAGGNAAANQLNLRNLGSVRNLVLFDGHRVPPTSVNNIVDVDMIPQLLLQRTETVTGGVSAIYGSDAITGVTNFITDKTFTGVKVLAQGGVSERGDGGQVDLGAAFGTNLSDRAHFEVSYEYRKDQGVLRRSDRSFLTQQSIEGAGTAASPFQLFDNVRIANQPFGGRITCGGTCAINGQYFATDGVLSPFVNGATTAAATPNFQVGGAGGYYDSSLRAPLESHQAFARLDYDLTDDVHAYVAGLYNNNTNEQFITPPATAGLTLRTENAFLAPAYRTALANAGLTTFTFGKLFSQAPRLHPVSESEQYWLNGGLDGKIGAFTWGAAYSHAKATLRTTLLDNVDNQRLAAALDAVTVGGQPACYAATQAATAATYANCVPLNLFGPTSASQAAIDYVLTDSQLVATTKLDDATAQIAGPLFDTWAGPVNVALSGELRRLSFRSTSDALPTQRADCTNIRNNCTANTFLYANTFAARTPVSDTVKEIALEADVPLLRDSAIAQEFNVNGAVRYTRYKTSGEYWTWKVGFDWNVTDRLRLRGTRSRDIRAPTLDDLFQPTSSGTNGNTDRLTGITPVPAITAIATGNPDLRAEIGNTLTAGVVWRPFDRFSVAVDAYKVKISNAVSNVQGFNPTVQDACYASGGTSPYCALQVRPLGFSNTSAANLVTQWISSVINLAEIETWGIDFEANYATSIAGRPFSARLLASYQPDLIYRTPALVTVDQAGSAFSTNGLQASPKLRVTGFLRYAVTDNFAVDVLERWRSALRHSNDPTQIWIDNHVDTFATTNLNLAFRTKGSLGDAEFFVNIQNLFDATPPPTAFFGAATIPGQFGGFAIGDDPIGRYFTAGVRLKL